MTQRKDEHEMTEDEYAAYLAETQPAVDWLMAVRKYGIDKANEMFPEG